MRKRVLAVLAVAGNLVAACDNGGSAVQTRDRVQPVAEMPAGAVPSQDIGPLVTTGAVPDVKATGVLTANRRETADAKAVRLFQRNGADFEADSAEDYLAKAKAFTSRPPSDAEKVSRPNGDVLIYQARTNTFAVVDKRGVVRTMFKPSSGADYWAHQKSTASSSGN
ncbi:S-type pyocin family protein [Brevundimonas sp.]|uniref:S-type pyocin family protein n=1 Tax=Brevundimonas sp. TaxID=1871086 RepID=UPI002897F16E|nr:S-type pyocin family protein [Brevundimonas sp.]